MLEILTQHWISLIFGLISAGCIAYAKHIHNQYKKLRQFEYNHEHEEVEDLIQRKIKETVSPFEKKLEADFHRFQALRKWMKHSIIDMCQHYLEQGYMTVEEYENLSELYSAYHDMDGNGQAQEYYEKTQKLQIKNNLKEKKGEE